MSNNLATDLKHDSRLKRNLLRVLLFLVIIVLADLGVSAILLRGVERFYGLGSDTAILMIGHSHLMLAVDKVALEEETGLTVAKYTREGVNMADRKEMIEQYFNTAVAEPEFVILSIDPWLFSGEGLSAYSWKLFLPFMENEVMDEYIESSAESRFDYLRYKFIRTSRYNAQLLNASARGWLHNWENLKYGVIDTLRYSSPERLLAFRPITFSHELMDDFAETLRYLNERDTKVLLLNTPVWQPLIDANRSGYDRSLALIDSIAGANCPGAAVIDLAPRFSDRTELFFDPIHMNPEGQAVVTRAVAEIINSLKEEE